MVAAIVVLYNPDLQMLDRLMLSIIGQVERVFVIDNTTGSPPDFPSCFDKYHNRISYIPLGENRGIATAQNVGIRKSMDAGCSHLLLLDQDSTPPPNMVEQLLMAEARLIQRGEIVGAVGPVFVDDKTGEISCATRQLCLHVRKTEIRDRSQFPIETDYVIASGSLIRRSVIEDVGMMLDELFIDLVDIEWGLRARSKGYKSYVVPQAMMEHSVGDNAIFSFGRHIYIHDGHRDYYRVRNATYLLRKRHMGLCWRLNTVFRIPKYILLYSFLSPNRRTRFKLLLFAFVDGMRARIGRYS